MSRDRKRRVLVPFEVGSFLKAPYGWTMTQRRKDLGPPRPLSRRARTTMNWTLALTYLAMAASAWLGAVVWHGLVGALIGFGILVVLGSFVGVVLMVLTGVRDRPRDDGSDHPPH